jgi:hypothetical protein
VHADIAELDAVVLEGFYGKANVGARRAWARWATAGAAAAVANAVFNATGVRVRDYPIPLDKVLRGCRPQIRDQAAGGAAVFWYCYPMPSRVLALWSGMSRAASEAIWGSLM